MLRWALIFLVVALIAGVFGFLGLASAAVGIARVLFALFLVLFLVALIGHRQARVKVRASRDQDGSKRRVEMSKRIFAVLLSITICGLLTGARPSHDETERLANAGAVLDEILSVQEDIPQELLDKAECVVVFPSVKEAAFIVGGQYGRGVMVCRSGSNHMGPWGAPAMMALEGGSVGLQIGGQSVDLVLLIMNKRGADSLLSSKVKLGADASVAAGPKGRSALAATDAFLRAEILSYSRSRGLFAGISLEGTTVRPDDDASSKVYGREVKAREILGGGANVSVPEAGRRLVNRLQKASPQNLSDVDTTPKQSSSSAATNGDDSHKTTNGDSHRQNQAPRTQSDEARQRSVDRLAREVRHELVMLPYYSIFDNLTYKVEDRQVTLGGQVTRSSLRSDAENVVKDIEGVERVVNDIEVLPLSPNDDRIRRAVYYSLYSQNSPLFRYGVGSLDSIHIVVKNGHVTLEGYVDSEGHKNLAGIRAKSVSGTFSVRNNLRVVKNERS